MTYSLQNILGDLRRADADFDLIADGDRICVGLSGGKDSLTLLKCLCEYRKFGIKNFDVLAMFLDMTNGQADTSRLVEFCKSLGIDFYAEKTEIFDIIKAKAKEGQSKPLCSLCANLRRGILNSRAKELKCNKVALGHHADDMIETFFLSLLYEGRINTFNAKTYLDRIDITVIRPLVYADEREIIAVSKDFPILKNLCPFDGHTKRQDMKNLIAELDKKIPDCRERIVNACKTLL